MLQRYVHFVQCIYKTHIHHVKKMQGNIRIALTLSTLKNKNILTTDWIENKFIKFIMLIYVLKNPKWAIEVKKTLLALFCIVCQHVTSTGTISNTSTYQPQSVTAKLPIIQGHIKMRDDPLHKCVIDELHQSHTTQ